MTPPVVPPQTYHIVYNCQVVAECPSILPQSRIDAVEDFVLPLMGEINIIDTKRRVEIPNWIEDYYLTLAESRHLMESYRKRNNIGREIGVILITNGKNPNRYQGLASLRTHNIFVVEYRNTEITLAHEILHLAGYKHVEDRRSIMNTPSCPGVTNLFDCTSDGLEKFSPGEVDMLRRLPF